MNEKLNMMLITIDCLRADHVSCLGYVRKTTPNLDNFAKKGVLFTQAIANGSSTPTSFLSIVTSTYPLKYPDYPHISKFRTTIAEVLKENGYKTAGFHSNPYTSRYYHYDRGFEVFEDFLSPQIDEKRVSKGIKDIIRKNETLCAFTRKLYKLLPNVKRRIGPISLPYQRASVINQKAISWLEKTTSGFFTWLHYMDTHHPFVPPKQFCNSNTHKIKRAEDILRKNPPIVSQTDLQNIINLYDGTIMYVDQVLGDLFKELKRLDIFDNTFIIITADHGEEFREHGGFSHTAKLYDELIHVPLILRAPTLPANIRIDELVSLLDLAPTILDYLDLPDCKNFEGKSLLPLIIEEEKVWNEEGVISETLTKNGRVVLSMEKGYRVISRRTKNWKYILNEEENKKELYNLENDPYETKNLYDQEKKIAEHTKMEERMHKKVIEMARIKNKIKHMKMMKLARTRR